MSVSHVSLRHWWLKTVFWVSVRVHTLLILHSSVQHRFAVLVAVDAAHP
jgi:hypothetical protein